MARLYYLVPAVLLLACVCGAAGSSLLDPDTIIKQTPDELVRERGGRGAQQRSA